MPANLSHLANIHPGSARPLRTPSVAFLCSNSVLCRFAFIFLVSKVQFPLLTDGMVDYGVAPIIYRSFTVWLTVVLTVSTALLPDMVWTVWWFSHGLQVLAPLPQSPSPNSTHSRWNTLFAPTLQIHHWDCHSLLQLYCIAATPC